MIIAYLTDHVSATGAELCELLDLQPTRVRTILREMIAEGIAAEDARKAEAARIEAERIRDENRQLHQENIQYRERLREREQAALDEYRRN